MTTLQTVTVLKTVYLCNKNNTLALQNRQADHILLRIVLKTQPEVEIGREHTTYKVLGEGQMGVLGNVYIYVYTHGVFCFVN